MANAITFNDLTDNRVYQRIGVNASISVSGNWDVSGTTPVIIEYKIFNYVDSSIAVDWGTITSTVIGSNFWNGSIFVPQGGAYKISFRSKNGSGTVLATATTGTHQFLVGDLFVFAGASSFDRWFFDGSFTPNANIRRYYTTNAYGNPAGGQVWSQFPGSNNGPAVNFCNQMYAYLGVPIGILGFGVSGSNLDSWQSGQANWTAFVAGLAANGNNVKAVYFCILNDLSSATVYSLSSWMSRYQAVITNTKAILGNNIPYTLISYQEIYDIVTDWTADTIAVRNGELAFGITPNTYILFRIDAGQTADHVHIDTPALARDADRCVQQYKFYQGTTGFYRGPYMYGGFYTGTTAIINIAHRGGTDFTPTGNITTFTASDASGSITLSNVFRLNPVTIQSTLSRPVSGTLSIGHLWTQYPNITGIVKDNSSMNLALEPGQIILGLSGVLGGGWSC